jgi:hypothetical protein
MNGMGMFSSAFLVFEKVTYNILVIVTQFALLWNRDTKI